MFVIVIFIIIIYILINIIDRNHSRRSVESAREMEAKNPLSLSELFRFLLYFYDEEFTDDPFQNEKQKQLLQKQQSRKSSSVSSDGPSKVNMPHLKGAAIENILMFVYQKYCGWDLEIIFIDKFHLFIFVL